MVVILNTKHDEYLKQAEFCRDMAERSQSPEREAEWLRLAKLWLSLSQLSASGRIDPILAAIIKSSSDKDTE